MRVWEDNAGAEGSLAKGASHSEDHNLLIHAIWYMAAKYGFGLWIERVASDDNISDCPSRERYDGWHRQRHKNCGRRDVGHNIRSSLSIFACASGIAFTIHERGAEIGIISHE